MNVLRDISSHYATLYRQLVKSDYRPDDVLVFQPYWKFTHAVEYTVQKFESLSASDRQKEVRGLWGSVIWHGVVMAVWLVVLVFVFRILTAPGTRVLDKVLVALLCAGTVVVILYNPSKLLSTINYLQKVKGRQ